MNMITLTIDGQKVTVPESTTIWQAARQLGIEIPTLCHAPDMNPAGVCRMCVVDVRERVLAASCVRECQHGMNVATSSPDVERHRRVLTQLLLAEHPTPCAREETTKDCQLEQLGRRYGLIDPGGAEADGPALPAGDAAARPSDLSSPVIAVDHRACILCDRCIRACNDIQSNDVIGRTGKGHASRIAFDLDQPMGTSTCVSCGECASACPTGALTHKPITLPIVARDVLTSVDTICPYCGVGCAVTYHCQDDQIVFAEGRDSRVNRGRL